MRTAAERQRATAYSRTAVYYRTTVAISLVLTSALSALWVALMPPFPPTAAEQLAAIADSGDTAVISSSAFIVAQLPFIIALLGIAHLTAQRTPILSAIGGALGVIGGFGHAVFGGFQLVTIVMAPDVANRELFAGLLESEPPLPLQVFMMAGTAGTVLGILLLGIALMRAKVGQRWVPYALWAFLVVEFVGSNLSEWAGLVAGLLYLGSFSALAVTVWRGTADSWTPVVAAGVPTAGAAAAVPRH
ncbi:hypothetical protein [Salinibacterium sp. ZJ450]|uniref:hypothetical protein n=1 Tax=Salinibacterium sp. ZJ450 TaxID=2708338 RepID=UPI001CD2308A|nr:hypothetical protein [Salinibacterium sp. ZJ450]